MQQPRSSPCESSSTLAMVPDHNDGSEDGSSSHTRTLSSPAKELSAAAWNVRKFGLLLALFQVAFILLFAVFVQYDWDALPVSHRRSPPEVPHVAVISQHQSLDPSATVTNLSRTLQTAQQGEARLMIDVAAEKYPLRDYFSMYGDIQVMIFLAFGLLIACFKRYGYSAMGISLVLGAFVVQWATLMHGFLDLQDGHIKLSVITLISADFSIAAVLITTCVVLGTLSPLQYLLLAFVEVIFYALNVCVCQRVLHVVDAGGSIYLHTFAAYFGLAVSLVMNRPKASVRELKNLAHGSKVSELLAMIGTLLLFIYWPSFNSVLAPADLQHRAIINTAVALVASTVGAFSVSAVVSKEKFSMTIIQNGALAGGVAIGSTADLMIQPYAALMIGFSAGAVAVIGFKYVNPLLERKLHLLDMCGVQYLHGFPGILAGLVSALVCGLASKSAYGSSFYGAFPAAVPMQGTEDFAQLHAIYPSLEPGDGRSQWTQAGFQLIAMAVSVTLAVVSGSICGLILKCKAFDPLQLDLMIDDAEIWSLPRNMSDDEESDIRDVLEKLGKILINRREVVRHSTSIKEQLKGLEACLKA